MSGRILAHLINNSLFGYANLSLVAFSLGTRVVFSCLKELAYLRSDKVFDVFLLGGAAPISAQEWRSCKTAVTGRLVNVFSKQDRVLSLLYSASRFEKAIGNYPIDADGVENYDLSGEVTNHLDYKAKMKTILKRVRYNN